MLFKKIKPVCSSLRNKMIVHHYRSKVFKKLCFSINRAQGRGVNGSIISYGKGGGNLFKYRYVDYSLDFLNLPYIFLGYDFDNYRTGWLGLVKYVNGCYSYILAPAQLEIGQLIIPNSSTTFNNFVGSRVQLKFLKVGSWIYGLESLKTKKMVFARAAGARCFIKAQDPILQKTVIKLPSKKLWKLPNYTCAYIGQVSNEMHYFEHYSKAGVGKIFNYRPSVRGEAMNAVDHHHGGKTKGGKKPKTPWGKIIKK